jgi:hypothetical protein
MDDALDLPRDENGRVVGYAIGREARMRDWVHRREKIDFEKLINRLRVAKWAKANPERRRAIARRHARKPEVRAKANERRRRARDAAVRAVVYACAHCGTTWCPVPWRQPRSNTSYCSTRCAKASRRRAAGAKPVPFNDGRLHGCIECGAPVAGRRKCCSTACYQRANYHTKRPDARRIARRGRAS